MIREQGISNKLFYYTSSGPYSTFNMREELILTQPVNAETWAKSVSGALRGFPELSVRPVVKDHRLFYEENHAPVPVFSEEWPDAEAREDRRRARRFGTEDTNGYLFYFLCHGNRILLSAFHGLADAVGLDSLVDSALYLYGKETGLAGAEDAVPKIWQERSVWAQKGRTLADLEEFRIDPYGMLERDRNLSAPQADFAVSSTTVVVPEESGVRQSMPSVTYGCSREEELVYSPRIRVQNIHFKLSDYLALTKRLGVSFTALLSPVIAAGIDRAADTKGKRIIVMLPVNLRPVYDVNTLVNFSDGILLPMEEEMRKRPLSEQASIIKEEMNAKIHTDTFDPVLSDKVRQVRSMESADVPFAQQGPKPYVSLPDGVEPPMSCVLTYPRRMERFSFLSGNHYSLISAASLAVLAYTSGEEMCLRVSQRSDTGQYAQGIAAVLRDEGVVSTVEDTGYETGDVLLPESVAADL